LKIGENHQKEALFLLSKAPFLTSFFCLERGSFCLRANLSI